MINVHFRVIYSLVLFHLSFKSDTDRSENTPGKGRESHFDTVPRERMIMFGQFNGVMAGPGPWRRPIRARPDHRHRQARVPGHGGAAHARARAAHLGFFHG